MVETLLSKLIYLIKQKKTDPKSVSHVNVSSFALKTDLANLKTEVDKLYIDKLTPVPSDLAKLSNVVKDDVVKKTAYNKLVTKVDKIGTTKFVSRTKYKNVDVEIKISDVDKKIPDGSGLVKKTDFNPNITEVEGKIPRITGLATNSALTAVENKIPDVTSLIKKTYFNAKLKKISDRVASNETKHLLVETELKKREKVDAAYFRGKNYLAGNDDTQNYLVFQGVYKYFERACNKICSWISKGVSNEKISSITTASNNTFATRLVYDNARIKVKFNGDFLKQDKVTYNHGPIVKIVYRLTPDIKDFSIIVEDCLFGSVKLTKNAGIDKYKYSGYGIGFDSRGTFSHPSGGNGKNIITFGADMSSYTKANNKPRSILVLGKDFNKDKE